jgi:hypothetical protein
LIAVKHLNHVFRNRNAFPETNHPPELALKSLCGYIDNIKGGVRDEKTIQCFCASDIYNPFFRIVFYTPTIFINYYCGRIVLFFKGTGLVFFNGNTSKIPGRRAGGHEWQRRIFPAWIFPGCLRGIQRDNR